MKQLLLLLIFLSCGKTYAQKFKSLPESYSLSINIPPPIENVQIFDTKNSESVDLNNLKKKYYSLSKNNLLPNSETKIYFNKKSKLIDRVLIKNDSIEYNFILKNNKVSKAEKRYNNIREEILVIDSLILIKSYRNDTIITEIEKRYEKRFHSWKNIKKTYKNSKLISKYNEAIRDLTTYYENGKLKSKQTNRETKVYDKKGNLTLWRKLGQFKKIYNKGVLVSEFYKESNDVFIRKKYNIQNGKLIKMIKTNHELRKETVIMYDNRGKIIKQEEYEILPPKGYPNFY